jgi:hypothetical protein
VKLNRLSFLARWALILATLIFVAVTLYDNWQDIRVLEIQRQGWLYAILALVINLVAHAWLGRVWGWILKDLQYPVPWRWSVVTFLIVEITKYLPGGIWQIYGRIRLAQRSGIPVKIGILSIVLESLSILAVAMGSGLLATSEPPLQGLFSFILVSILVGIHPVIFNGVIAGIHHVQDVPWIQWLISKLTGHPLETQNHAQLQVYPLTILGGMVAFLGLRSLSFVFVVLMFISLTWQKLAPLVGGFSLAWGLGIVAPGVSGGVGVFEATAIAQLDGIMAPQVVVVAALFYRAISILTEAIGAAAAWLLKGGREIPELMEYSRTE